MIDDLPRGELADNWELKSAADTIPPGPAFNRPNLPPLRRTGPLFAFSGITLRETCGQEISSGPAPAP